MLTARKGVQRGVSTRNIFLTVRVAQNVNMDVEVPDCSSLTVLVIADPVRAANVAEWEARKRDIRLNKSSFKHFEDSPSLRVRITLSCKVSATHNPVCVCIVDRTWGGEKHPYKSKSSTNKLNGAESTATDVVRNAHREVKDIHEHRMAFLRLLVQTGWGPDPVKVRSIGAQVQRGHAAAHWKVMCWHGHNLAHLKSVACIYVFDGVPKVYDFSCICLCHIPQRE